MIEFVVGDKEVGLSLGRKGWLVAKTWGGLWLLLRLLDLDPKKSFVR
jgi:hypothetical protein